MGGLLGLLFFLIGLFSNGIILWKWVSQDFGELNEVRLAVFGLTFMVLGLQTIFSSFFLSILGVERKYGNEEALPTNKKYEFHLRDENVTNRASESEHTIQ